MVIAIYGAGYVGLVSAVCFAKMGHRIICADINPSRVALLRKGECPIHEEGLQALLEAQLLSGRLHFTASLTEAVQQATVHIVATGTPSLPDGSADLSQIFAVATALAEDATAEGFLVIKSTVPVGTGDAVEAHLKRELTRLNKPYQFSVASNPEFLREGRALHDFLQADRIILGGVPVAIDILKVIYEPMIAAGIPLLCMSRGSAELTKYAANTMLACRISFMNQISRIAERVGASIDDIQAGLGSDHRIGPHFLQAGIGYGGSCLPKDTRALIQTARTLGIDVPLLEAIDEINHQQKNWVMDQLKMHFRAVLHGKMIGIWGLSFKPDTDDLREASSLVLIEALLASGARVRLFDPVAMPLAKTILPKNAAISWCSSAEEVITTPVDALIIATEWSVFKSYDLSLLQKALQEAPLIDGRNCFSLAAVGAAKMAYYYSVGRPQVVFSG